ncbi:translation initiation factor IF-3 [Candidatus Nomurabacteria bacterium]|uniref:Translation initiation factor IF-3 n=1 Tax=candidate division WWE3 bacterium TaxID=2053526 RepID=A0A955E282_UNCKA|nr:translation initiation factor IF-3 [candidate division WWE3 bacterium]MCB9823749.1 translation initiation factor IF-3 [Candidatus Nomurabacteria bacterium]MCB9827172.1 translation initiation factor IF-3 [Candidatus Nomurabacteria bacterium]MCB9827544.1 translation initiation factor IF-3 [Candidatus Nomurabacteria bacterium]HXK52583.1 translation initiation factor IF-3 [bacterium]
MKQEKSKYYKTNDRIRYPELRIVDDGDGENLGVLSTSEALAVARSKELDLVVITENAKPPIAKILDFNKYLYKERKKSSEIKAKAKKSKLKEFRFGPYIDEGAIKVKTDRAREFLMDGNQVKVTVVMKGREQAHPEIGVEKVEKFVAALTDIAKLEDQIRIQGRNIIAVLNKG